MILLKLNDFGTNLSISDFSVHLYSIKSIYNKYITNDMCTSVRLIYASDVDGDTATRHHGMEVSFSLSGLGVYVIHR
jgi:hypothetical protein